MFSSYVESLSKVVHDVEEAIGLATPPPPPPVNAKTTAQQPLLSASDWFLTSEELANSRGGLPREQLATFTTDNHVSAYAGTDQYFLSLLEELQGADVESVWITGWSLNHKVPLNPRAEEPATTSLEMILTAAVQSRAVHVRALVWMNMQAREECIATRDWMNALGEAATKGSALMLFDDRLPHAVSSHHQKMVVIQKHTGEIVAFLGGIDITVGRWDSVTHDNKALREALGIHDGSAGWIDAGVRLEGAAARDVAATFAARWNSSVQPENGLKEDLLDFENPKTYAPVIAPAVPAPCATHPTGASVQVVRTFSPHKASGMYPDFAPDGELSLHHARVKAISKAKNLIYIEDQYFFYMPQLMEALDAALARGVRVVVFVQRPTWLAQSRYTGSEELVYQMAKPLLDKYSTSFHIFTTKPHHDLYVHSKLLVVDDVFLSISSANWNRRSSTSDTEIGVSVVDTATVRAPGCEKDQVEVGALVHKYRLEKFAEMAGNSPQEWTELTIAQSCDALVAAASRTNSFLEPLVVEHKMEFIVFTEEFTLHVVDPDDLNHPEVSDDEE